MLKEEAVKHVHTRSICQRSDGRFVTKVGSSLNQKSAGSYKELIEKLYDYYFGVQNLTLESLFPKWIEYRKDFCSVKEKTIKEDVFMWNAYLKGQGITQKPIKAVSVNEYIIYFRFITKGRTLTRKRFNNLKSVMNGILYYAIELGVISHNPLSDINYQHFSKRLLNVLVVMK